MKRSPYSSHSNVTRILGQGHGRRLLDVGCAEGEIAAHLIDQGWQVVGIEPFVPDARVAASRGINVIQGTVEDVLPHLNDTFDAVLLADVLEHCANPWEQLRMVRRVCRPGAEVVISIPNVAHLSVRAQLLTGQFRYTGKGILDRTHLRFFTHQTAVELVEQAGFTLCETKFTPAPVELVVPNLQKTRLGRAALGANAALARFRPTLFAYQFIMVCRVSAPEG